MKKPPPELFCIEGPVPVCCWIGCDDEPLGFTSDGELLHRLAICQNPEDEESPAFLVACSSDWTKVWFWMYSEDSSPVEDLKEVLTNNEELWNDYADSSSESSKYLDINNDSMAAASVFEAFVEGLDEVSDTMAAQIVRYFNKELPIRLPNLTELSTEQIRILTLFNGTLFLDGITELSDEAAKTLANHNGQIFLHGLTNLTESAAHALGAHKSELNLGLTELSEGVAQALAKSEGQLGFEYLKDISDEAAQALAGFNGDLDLIGLNVLSDGAAVALAKHRGGWLRLLELNSLSATAARALLEHEGEVVTNNVDLEAVAQGEAENPSD